MIERKKSGRLFAALGTALLAALAASALAAGSVQAASWHVNSVPLSESTPNYRMFSHWTWDPGTVVMENFSLEARLECAVKPSSEAENGMVYNATKLKETVTLEECGITWDENLDGIEAYDLSEYCIQEKPVTFVFEGTGDAVSSSSSPTLKFEKGKACPFPLSHKLQISSLSLSYGEPSYLLDVSGSGVGTWGEHPMTVAADYTWFCHYQCTTLGWY